MNTPPELDRDDVQAEIVELRQTLDDLARMARQGLPVAEAQAKAQERLAVLEAQVVALGDVYGDVVTGTKETTFDLRGVRAEKLVNVAGNVYLGPPPQDAAEALVIYRRVLAQTCGQLPLRGVDLGAADATTGQEPLGLANVYVDWTPRPRWS